MTTNVIILIALFLGVSVYASGQISDSEKKIRETIKVFGQAGDDQDVKKLETVLDDDFRIVMNRLFGSEVSSVMSREIYLSKIKSKEFGGDERDITIDMLDVNGTVAFAKVTFKGIKSIIISYLDLVEDKNGNWLIVNDTPTFKPL